MIDYNGLRWRDPHQLHCTVANQLVRADACDPIHLHFANGTLTPREALVRLHNAAVHESAVIISLQPWIDPNSYPDPSVDVLTVLDREGVVRSIIEDLCGFVLRCRDAPNSRAARLTVSGDERCRPALTYVLPQLNALAAAKYPGLPELRDIELPLAMTTSRQSGADVPFGDATKTSAGPDVRVVDPLAPPSRAHLGPGGGNANKRRRRP